MTRKKLFAKYYKDDRHDYEITETISATDDSGRTPDICFVYSGRNRGKSFEVASQLIADAWFDKKLFGYIRRNVATTYEIEQYFEDKHGFISDMTDGAREGITRDKGKLWFYHMEVNDKGDVKKVLDEPAGYFFALSKQSSYKSLQYPELYNLLYEEVLTDSLYLGAEPEKLMNMYSTCRRSKPGFRMWLISNTVSIVNPYSNAWGLQLAKNKPGDVRLSKLYLNSYGKDGKEEYLLIACHYLVNKGDIISEDRKKKRNRIKTGISSNKWDETRLYPTIDKSFLDPYTPECTVVFEQDDLLFQLDIVIKPQNIMAMYLDGEDPVQSRMAFGFVQRKTTPPKDGTRIYTNNPARFGTLVTRGYRRICKIDDFVEDLRVKGWIIGADNLTMNDFYNIWSKLRNPFNG